MTNITVTMISISNLAKSWGCSRHFIWTKCRSGEIPAVKIGDRWFIPQWWVDQQEKVNVGFDGQLPCPNCGGGGHLPLKGGSDR